MNKKIAITLTRYNENNEIVKPCLIALSKQKKVNANVLFIDQKFDLEMKILCKKLSNKNVKFLYKKIPVKNLSYARNLGIKLAKTNIILFIDCDAIPDKHWAYNIYKCLLKDKNVAIVGGKSEPLWLTKPKWFCKSNIVKEMYSIIDISDKIIETKKIVGVNFGINKRLLKNEAYFNENLGRRPGTLLGGEETDLCKRCLTKGFKILYTPFAKVKHQIQTDRISLRWIIRRFYYGGYNRAILGGVPTPNTKKRNIFDYIILLIIIIPYFIGYIRWKK